MEGNRPTSVDCDGIVQRKARLKMLGAAVATLSLLVISVVLPRMV